MPEFSEEEVTAGARALAEKLGFYPEPAHDAIARAVLVASGAVPGAEHERVKRALDRSVDGLVEAVHESNSAARKRAVQDPVGTAHELQLRAELERVCSVYYEEGYEGHCFEINERMEGCAGRVSLDAAVQIQRERASVCEERLREAERLLRETLNAFVAAYSDDDPTPETIDRLANAMRAARGFLEGSEK